MYGKEKLANGFVFAIIFGNSKENLPRKGSNVERILYIVTGTPTSVLLGIIARTTTFIGNIFPVPYVRVVRWPFGLRQLWGGSGEEEDDDKMTGPGGAKSAAGEEDED